MPRPANIMRPVHLKTSLPEDLRARLDLHLWSEAEGRVPMGAYQRLFIRLLTQYLDAVEVKPLDPVQTGLSAFLDQKVSYDPQS